ncbi:MAG TPA: hypothetical protein VFV49_01580 [Thermoanaerobaculia bacterium]|nr:hypothetical protein [Thermoanaerobaculia bacterium]
MSANETRKLIGKSYAVGARTTVHQTHDGLEFETNEQYDVVQRRVFFEDVLMVTIHREIGPLYLIVTGAVALFFLGIALFIVSVNVDMWPAALIFGVFGFPALLAFLTRLFLGVDVVTIFGRRSKANVRFPLRKSRARALYTTICAAVRAAHRHAERANAPPVAEHVDDERGTEDE